MPIEFDVVDSPRPETKEEEDAYFLRAYRDALEKISHLLRLPGSPSLITDTVEGVRKLVAERNVATARVEEANKDIVAALELAVKADHDRDRLAAALRDLPDTIAAYYAARLPRRPTDEYTEAEHALWELVVSIKDRPWGNASTGKSGENDG